MRQARHGLVLAGALVTVLLLAGCGATSASTATAGNDNTGTSGGGTPQMTCTTTGAAICTKSIAVGGSTKTVLATSTGKTLYYFLSDTSSQIACSGSCATLWPPLMSPSAMMSDN